MGKWGFGNGYISVDLKGVVGFQKAQQLLASYNGGESQWIQLQMAEDKMQG